MAADSPFTVDADWLQQQLGKPGVTIVDASWYLPAHNRDPRAEYEAAHIPGAVFLDQDAVSDPASNLPHSLPGPQYFSRFVGTLGISADDTIVIYDGPGFFSAPRAWWMFRIMGVYQVFVLDGGFDNWKAQARPTTSQATKIAPCVFHAEFDEKSVVSLAQMRKIVDERKSQIADARGAGRFAGTEPEPRAGVRSGHMPGAYNVPVNTLSKDGMLLPIPQLCRLFEEAGLDLTRPIITSCGSGITAAALTLALETLGHGDNRLYDGSWTEWGSLSDTPVETGAGKAAQS
ncbi:3-mercaptopyruvate sulfurtransferase [Aquamicrobium segne]|uniref:3-mercaptopyruvate sulfurtransferase n=1 Tax=Aquamicrobium segne TaxID=469547 RepID=A0ABW0GWA7_9HYPH